MAAAASATGSRVLSEIEETTLDELLTSLRSAFTELNSRDATKAAAEAAATGPGAAAARAGRQPQQQLKAFPIPALNGLAAKHLRATQAAVVSVSGRQLPLIYLLVATLIAPPHAKTVVVVDLESRFDITRVLECTPYAVTATTTATTAAPPAPAPATAPAPVGADASVAATGSGEEATRPLHDDRQRSAVLSKGAVAPAAGPATTPPVPAADQSQVSGSRVSLSDLAHVHVHRPARGSGASASLVGEVVAAAEQHMLYGAHGSGGREWWGTFVVGGSGGHHSAGGGGSAPLLPRGAVLSSSSSSSVDVAAGPRGWLRVERGEVGGFGIGTSAEEALRDRERRRRAVDAAGWTATSIWGGFTFHEN